MDKATIRAYLGGNWRTARRDQSCDVCHFPILQGERYLVDRDLSRQHTHCAETSAFYKRDAERAQEGGR